MICPSPLLRYFMNYLCNVIKYSRCLIFVDDTKIFLVINSLNDCILMQPDLECIQGWCPAKIMKLNIDRRRVITFTIKTDPLKLCDISMIWTDTIKDLRFKIIFLSTHWLYSFIINWITRLCSICNIFHFYNQRFDCWCMLPKLDPRWNMTQLLGIQLYLQKPKILNTSSRNLYLCIKPFIVPWTF